MIFVLVYPTYLMNFNIQRFKYDPLSIMNLLIENLETMMTMQNGRIRSSSTTVILEALKDKAHKVEMIYQILEFGGINISGNMRLMKGTVKDLFIKWTSAQII